MTEVPGCSANFPRGRFGFISAEQHSFTFLTTVHVGLKINAVWYLLTKVCNFVHALGDQIMVLHRLNRQVNACHLANLSRPKTAAVHNVLRVDRTFGGDNVPASVGTLRHIGGATVGEIMSAMRLGRLGKRIGRTGRVEMAVLCVPQNRVIVVRIDQRMTLGQLLGRNEFLIQTHVARF